MSRDPFARLALVTLCTAHIVGLALAWRYLGWQTATVAGAAGLLLAAALTIERTLAPVPPPEREGLSRSQISRRHPPDHDDDVLG